jgi:trehalose/maltose transport system substrate-binding protein
MGGSGGGLAIRLHGLVLIAYLFVSHAEQALDERVVGVGLLELGERGLIVAAIIRHIAHQIRIESLLLIREAGIFGFHFLERGFRGDDVLPCFGLVAAARCDPRQGVLGAKLPQVLTRGRDIRLLHAGVVADFVPLPSGIQIARIDADARRFIGHFSLLVIIGNSHPVVENHLLVLHGIPAIAIESVGHSHRALRVGLRSRRLGGVDGLLKIMTSFTAPAHQIQDDADSIQSLLRVRRFREILLVRGQGFAQFAVAHQLLRLAGRFRLRSSTALRGEHRGTHYYNGANVQNRTNFARHRSDYRIEVAVVLRWGASTKGVASPGCYDEQVVSRIRMAATCFGRVVARGFLCLALLLSLGCGRGPSRAVTLTVLGFSVDAGQALRTDALEEFTRETGIGVDLIPTWGTSSEQLSQKIRLLKQHATTPDIYLLDVVWTGTLGEHLLDLQPYAGQESRGHIPALLANDTVGGRLVSLPFYVNIGMLYYRTDLLAKYGFTHPPGAWNELAGMAAKIQEGERSAGHELFWGYVWQGAAYEGLTCNALEWQSSFGGGRIIEPDGTISVNNPHTAEALRNAARWIGSVSPASVLSYNESDSLNAFRAGNAAFLRYWSSGVAGAGDGSGNSPIRGHFAATLLPAGPHGRAQSMGGFHLAVSRYSTHPRESARLVMYLTGGPVQLRRATARGALPTIPQLYNDPALTKSLPYAGVLRTAGDAAWVARPSTIAGGRYAAVSEAYYKTVHRILENETSPSAGLAALERQLVDLTGLRTGAPMEQR